jgi:hypothetical protein
MSGTDTITIGEALPRLKSIAPHGGLEVAADWASGRSDVVDLGPVILTHKFYKPLREDADLFKTVHLVEDGAAIAWGNDDAIDMAATTIERLAAEIMSSDDFGAWMNRNKLTYDAAAAQLGISRRLVAYYANGQRIPRYIALACRALDSLADPLAPTGQGDVMGTAQTKLVLPPMMRGSFEPFVAQTTAAGEGAVKVRVPRAKPPTKKSRKRKSSRKTPGARLRRV